MPEKVKIAFETLYKNLKMKDMSFSKFEDMTRLLDLPYGCTIKWKGEF